MKNSLVRKLKESKDKVFIFTASILLAYLLISLYFTKHFFFGTVVNGVNISLKAHGDAQRIIKNYISDYEIRLLQRDGKTEKISAQDIGMRFNARRNSTDILKKQNSLWWISFLFKKQRFNINGLYTFDQGDLNNRINQLDCLNKDIIKPQNASFRYSNGSFEVVEAVYGNEINRDKLYETVKTAISSGKAELDLDKALCYKKPEYTADSDKTFMTRDSLNQHVATKVIYDFGSKKEILDGNTIKEWLGVDENLDVMVDEAAVMEYVKALAVKYDTVGAVRMFKTSTGKTVEVEGGLYGWQINQEAETKAILENICGGEEMEREPVYTRKALFREENDIGTTYVEINISKQHLWFYKDGKLITHGAVVTGNPNKGNSTVLGTYMINYKENGSTLSGRNYNVRVSYWMPFYGNIGLHDASWRSAFGGEIYKRNGTHGCVNAPLYLAKTVYENIEEGTPVVCYEE